MYLRAVVLFRILQESWSLVIQAAQQMLFGQVLLVSLLSLEAGYNVLLKI